MLTTKFTDNTNLNLANPFNDVPTGIPHHDYITRLFECLFHYSPRIIFTVTTRMAGDDIDITIVANA